MSEQSDIEKDYVKNNYKLNEYPRLFIRPMVVSKNNYKLNEYPRLFIRPMVVSKNNYKSDHRLHKSSEFVQAPSVFKLGPRISSQNPIALGINWNIL